MPEPLLYIESLGISALVSAICALGLTRSRAISVARLNAVSVLAAGLGMAAGCWMLRWPIVWPPASAIDRATTIIIPVALGIELVAGSVKVGPVLARALRGLFILLAPCVLLWGSIHLTGSSGSAWLWLAMLLLSSSALLATLWIPLLRLSSHSKSGMSIAASLALAILCAGAAVMLGGYLKGGAVAFALAGALAGTAFAATRITPRIGAAIVTTGVAQLACVVGTGYFFGRLSTASASGLLLSPLLCFVSEVPRVRSWPARRIAILRLLLVATLLLLIVAVAFFEFRRKMARLLSADHSAVSIST